MPAASAISSTVTSLNPRWAKSSHTICSYLACSRLRRLLQPDSTPSVTAAIVARDAAIPLTHCYRVSRMQPAIGPPPLEATATSRRWTWRAPASPRSCRQASWRTQ